MKKPNKVSIEAIEYRLGENIAKLRVKQGFSQEKFAEACGIDRSHWGKCELGYYSISVGKLNKIANVLGCSISDLFKKPDGSDI